MLTGVTGVWGSLLSKGRRGASARIPGTRRLLRRGPKADARDGDESLTGEVRDEEVRLDRGRMGEGVNVVPCEEGATHVVFDRKPSGKSSAEKDTSLASSCSLGEAMVRRETCSKILASISLTAV